MTLRWVDCDLNHNCTCLMLEHTFGRGNTFVKQVDAFYYRNETLYHI